MSAPTSPNLPRSDQSSVDQFGFEGAEELWQSWRDGLTPDPLLTVSEWADRHRFLSPRASAEPGRYRTDRTPYMRAIMDALSPSHPARRIVFMKAAQVGATEAGNNWIGYVIHHAPGPMLSVQPTGELAKRFSRQRIEPVIAESPALRERVKPARARDAGNTVLSKEFPAGLLVITGANSAVGLRSMPARYLFLAAVAAYPPSADEEGDPVALAEARTRTFSWRSKVFLTSTPTIHGVSRIEREFEASDQRRYFVACPHCDHRQWLRFERLRWEKGQPNTAHYSCEACDGQIEEHHKTALM
ncbi:MAG: phage terminase large subunit family protein, partial [Rhodospirillales bacterium]